VRKCPGISDEVLQVYRNSAIGAWSRDHATSLVTAVLPPPGQRCGTVCLNSFGNRTSPSDNTNDRWKRLCLVSLAAAPCVWTLRAPTRNLLTYLLTYFRRRVLVHHTPRECIGWPNRRLLSGALAFVWKILVLAAVLELNPTVTLLHCPITSSMASVFYADVKALTCSLTLIYDVVKCA